ncbi:hypothetical protein N9C48_01005 [bacterium]|jgi:hypothetical protein|nr:hypothetical protein [bacterium]
MVNYLNTMYSNKSQSSKASKKESTKNPNRVAGGLKGQGVDHFVMVSEDGSEQQVPSQRYVNSLEEQIRKQRGAINVLERKLARCESSIERLNSLNSTS